MNPTTTAALAPEAMAALWATVLGVSHIGADEDLAEYGADSLDTARVVARIRQVCGRDVPFRVAFEATTPRALAEALDSCEPAPAADGGALRVATERALWPLSHDQQRLWLIDQNGDGANGTAYHVRLVLRLRGELDVAVLRRAWRDVVARHGSLRTRFVLDGHEPAQEVLASWPVELGTEDAAGVDDVLDRVGDLAAARFDLAAAPPWRAVLYRLADDDHVLAFVIHHIVFDGWSEEVLRRELGELYAAHRGGRAANLPELTVQYTDHAVWQREVADSSYAAELAYWRRQLAGLAPLDLPADRPRPSARTGEGAGHTFTVDAGLGARIRELARANGATPFMVLLAAWNALLGRLCDATEVVVGASTADRGRPELEDLIGMFVNVLVIRSDVTGSRSFVDLLAAVRATTLDAFAHRELPFERLVAELAPDRTASHNPLFNVNFVYLNLPAADDGWAGLEVEPLTLATSTTAFDVILAVQDRPDGGLGCYLEYSTELFDAATVERIGRYYERLLAGFVADPLVPIGTVDLLDTAERRELVLDPNAVTAPLPPDSLHAFVERHAVRTPTAVAVACGDRQLGYADLDAQANRLANHLRAVGVGRETAVAIRLPRSADQVVAMVAVWKAGGYYVPLDDEQPPDRVATILAQVRDTVGATGLVLVTRGAERVAAAGPTTVVCLDRDGADIAAAPDTRPDSADVPPDALAAVIHTSGSTGVPKPVAVTHRNVLAAQISRDAIGTPPRRALLPVSFAFDVFLSFAVWTLREGGLLVVPVQSRGADLDELATLLTAQRITHLVAPPDLQRALFARDDVRAANHLVLGVVGGQSCPRALAEDYGRWTAGGRLVNEYGATETSSSGTYLVTAGEGDPDSPGQLSIGRPAANCRVYLLDANLLPVPMGVTGELYLGGPALVRGYLGRPGMTADRFVPDPFGDAGERLYRSGDLARLRPDGTYEFLGRQDRQVKIRGFRIELAEIEAALVTHGSVGSAAVCHFPDREELVAYVTGHVGPDATPPPSAEELRAHLQRLLPEPMVPAAFVTVAEMPLTPHGKIDREALAELGVEPEPSAAYTGPRTPAERTVAEVWAEVLEIAEVDIHTDFFKLGGHSLLAANVVSRLRTKFPVPLGMRDLFGSPTVAQLAELIGARVLESVRDQFGDQVAAAAPVAAASAPAAPVSAPASAAVPTPAVPAVPVSVPADDTIRPAAEGRTSAPLSAGQLQLWLVDRVRSGSRPYQVPHALRLVGHLDVPALRAALDGLVARHEVLRTTIDLVDDEPTQLVHEPRDVPLPIVRSAPDGLAALLDGIVAEPFDLAADQLLRAALVKLSDSEHVLLLVMHHIACDGPSADILIEDLAELYGARVDGREPSLRPLRVRYTDFASWYHRRADGEAQRAQLDHWRRRLSGVTALRLPTDRPAPADPDPTGGRVEFRLDRDLAERVRTLAGRHGATPFMTLLAAFKVLLVRIGAGTDLAVGVPVAGRGRPELHGVVGYFGNTIVLRTELPPTVTFADALDRVRRVTADGLANQDVAFARVVKATTAERGRGAAPLFSVMFSYESTPAPLPAIGTLAATTIRMPMRAAPFDVTLRLTEQADGSMVGELDYRTALFDHETAERLAERYVRTLRQVLAAPQATIESVSLLDDTDTGALAAWNDTAREYPLAPLPRLVAEQVARTPDAPAVWSGGGWATYAEFGAGVNRLAAYLRRRGVGVEDVVGVCLPAGAAMVTAVHAVVAAGGAYLPLPPDQPAARLATMIDDARPVAVITTAELAGAIAEAGATGVVCVDAGHPDAAAIAAEPGAPVEVDVPLDALAYVMFTSGSTGRPKGVGVSHRAIVDRLRWMQEAYGLDDGERVLFKTPFSFDVSVPELFWPLLTGAGLVVVDDGDHRDLDRLADVARSTGATTAQFVPSILALFLEEPRLDDRLVSLRRVLCAGEALPADLVARFRAVLPHVELHNLYGPTEATVYASAHPCDGADAVVPIGRPLANTRLEVLDPYGDRVPVGVPGELCLGGGPLARGYLGRPGLTAERFVPDPYAGRPGQRLYRTGDLARWRADGTVEYLGRLDHQLKIRGVRIEPGEIETALRGHPAVSGAAVVAWRPADSDTRLVAYVVGVTATGEPPSAAELRGFLRTRLPAAMIPSRFVALPSFPLTSSGKLDRRALPSPDSRHQVGDLVVRDVITGPASTLVWLRREGGAAPLFCVHPGDGSAYWYTQLAEALGASQPVAAFEWPVGVVDDTTGGGGVNGANDNGANGVGATNGAAADGSGGGIERVARRFLGELRAARPTGPYRLLGWCGGAAVTWELACQLDDAGERVELWLIDPLVDVAQRPVSAQQLALFRQSEKLFTDLDAEPDQAAAEARRADVVEYLRLTIEDPGVSVTAEDVRSRVRAGRELLEASIDYRFRTYRGRLRLLVGDEVPGADHVVMSGQGYQQYLDRWRELAAGGLDTHRIPGDHLGVLRPPHVDRLAALLTEHPLTIDRADLPG